MPVGPDLAFRVTSQQCSCFTTADLFGSGPTFRRAPPMLSAIWSTRPGKDVVNIIRVAS
jgi:hypothetical protein